MSNRPASGLTAYQRWELDSFDGPAHRGATPCAAPDPAELSRIQEEARKAGAAAGYREGAARATEEAARLGQLAGALVAGLQELDERIAEDVLNLSLAIANQVLREALAIRPELILAVVRQVLGDLPRGTQRAHLLLSPSDATLVREKLGERLAQTGVQVVEDPQIRAGGCRVETPECDVDATLERRWQRVAAAIGSDHGWIE